MGSEALAKENVISAIAELYGYVALKMTVRVKDGEKIPKVHFRAKRKFTPEIYVDFPNSERGDLTPVIEIETTSYGSLPMNEYEDFLKDTRDAYDFAKYLLSVDYDGLPREQ